MSEQESYRSLTGELVTYYKNRTLFVSGPVTSKKTVIYVGGLSDGFLSVPYLPRLSDYLANLGWSLAQVYLSSSYNQYGLSTLDKDVKELSAAIKFLKEKKGKEMIVMMGHSTGCQDAIHYLASLEKEPRATIAGAILQAPVSDREYLDDNIGDASDGSEAEVLKWVKLSEKMVREGRGGGWLPKEASQSLTPEANPEYASFAPFTAYRFYSLYGKGGDDDYFSTDLASESLAFQKSKAPMLILLGESDECYPKAMTDNPSEIQALLEVWKLASRGSISQHSAVLKGADHSVRDPEALNQMLDLIRAFLAGIEG